MLTSLQGSDIWDEANQVNNAGTMGTFSGEAGGSIKAFNNTFDADIATNNMRFVAYGDTNPLYNIAGKTNSTTDFDAYLATSRGEVVSSNIKSKSGANTYNNFDTNAALYVKNLVIDQPATAKTKVTQYAGRVSGGDLKWTFNNSVDDKSSLVIAALKSALTNYTSSLVAVQGEGTPPANPQTLTSTTNNNQTVASGTAISAIVFTWGGSATDATVTGLPASGISFVKNTSAKTITISGTPTATVSYSIATVGTGIAATGAGTITVTTSNPSTNEIHNFTTSGKTSSFYTITGNMNSTPGSVTYNGLTLNERLKIESSTTVTYTTTSASTLTLVFDSNFTGTVKVNNTSYTAAAGIVTATIPAGTNTITKGSVANLFYINTEYTGSTLRKANFEETKTIEIAKPVLYPNPVTNSLSITSASQNIEKAAIYNISGMLVKTVDKNLETIDVSNLTAGTYLVKIYTSEGSFNQTLLKK